ncbi:hypothetical protein VSP53_04815, partial [Escherichia coli]|uniref:hypothetical protein n=1 Tax=Escherichia coli TaxID=562 RepID=UPI002DBC676C
RAYCLKTQPATGETYPKSDLFNKARGISQQGNIQIKWLEAGKPVNCLAHYQQNAEAEKIAQTIIINGINCQIQ